MYTYKCGDLTYLGEASIGFVTTDGLFANHFATIRGKAQSIACLNMPSTPWVNVVYDITRSGGCTKILLNTLQILYVPIILEWKTMLTYLH